MSRDKIAVRPLGSADKSCGKLAIVSTPSIYHSFGLPTCPGMRC